MQFRHSRALAAALFFFMLALAWLWPLPLRLTSRIPHDLGDPLLNTWILWWNTQAVPFSERWWSPPVFFPLPGTFALSEHLLGIAIFTAPLHFLGLSPAGAYNVALIMSSWLSGLFAFLLGRRLTGSALAGLVAGVAFALAPYRAAHLTHLQVLTSQWMPLALMAMHGYLDERRRRWLVLVAAAWLLQALSNGYYMLFFPVLVALWLAWFVRWRRDPLPGVALIATFAAASLLLLPALLKYRAVHDVLGLVRQRGEMLLFSAEPASLYRIPGLLAFWPGSSGRTQEDFLFPGITALLIIVAGLIVLATREPLTEAVRRRSPFLFYAAATPILWWLALGPAPEGETLLAFVKPYTWLTVLPGFSGLRAPARFGMLASVTMGAAAALGVRQIAPSHVLLRGVVVAVALGGLVLDGWIERVPLVSPPGRIVLPAVEGASVLELPIAFEEVSTTAMSRSITHGLPLINGYSGHKPAHLRLLASAMQRDDPSALLHFAEGHPLIIVINSRFDSDGASRNVVRQLPGVRDGGASGIGPVFVIPAQPRRRLGPTGPALGIVSITQEERQHAVVDLGRPELIREVTFPVRWHFDEIGPRLQVEASDDGVRWTSVWYEWTGGTAIAGALENARLVPFRMQVPDIRARYLRIHPAPNWMTSELAVLPPR